jgi:hypothetical protein
VGGLTAAARAVWGRAADSVRRLRSSHPVRVLRWLRNGVLLAVLATLLLCFGVATEAHHRIIAARDTDQAIREINSAYGAADAASAALKQAFDRGDPTLSGTGSVFAIDATQTNEYLTAAAEDNAAGALGEEQLQFVQGQLATCTSLADTAVLAYSTAVLENSSLKNSALGTATVQSASSCLTDPDQHVAGTTIPDTGGLTYALNDLRKLESAALSAQLSSPWLDPAVYLCLLLAPPGAILILLIATGRVLARHFRRLISPLLVGALVDTVVVALVFGALSASDDGHLAAAPWTAAWETTASVSVLLATALVLTYLGYRPRLAEYRFGAS